MGFASLLEDIQTRFQSFDFQSLIGPPGSVSVELAPTEYYGYFDRTADHPLDQVFRSLRRTVELAQPRIGANVVETDWSKVGQNLDEVDKKIKELGAKNLFQGEASIKASSAAIESQMKNAIDQGAQFFNFFGKETKTIFDLLENVDLLLDNNAQIKLSDVHDALYKDAIFLKGKYESLASDFESLQAQHDELMLDLAGDVQDLLMSDIKRSPK